MAFQGGPVGDGLQRVGEGRRPRVDDMLTGDQDGALDAAADQRDATPNLLGLDRHHIFHPVGLGAGEQRGQARVFGLGPGNHDGRGLDQWKVEGLADGQIFIITFAHAGELQAVWRRVVAGMEKG